MQQLRPLLKVYYFRHWTRQNFAVFNSLHKLISISTLSLACSLLLKPTASFAQQDSSKLHKILDEVSVTTDAPSEIPIMEPFFIVTALSQQDFSQSAKHSVNELLSQLPGVDIRQRGILGVQADISFRGGNFDQTLLLLNGINFSDPQTGHYTLNLPISTDLVRKVELFKNTTAFLYGTTPFSGMINLVTSPDSVNNLYFHLMGGMYGLYRIHTQLHWQSPYFKHLFSIEYSYADGYKKNSDFGIINGFYQNIGEFKNGKMLFQLGFNQKKYGANSFYSLLYPNQYEETETFLVSFRWENSKKVPLAFSVYYRMNEDIFQLQKWQNLKKNNQHLNQIMGSNFTYFFNTILGKTTLVADVRLEKIISTSLGKELPKPLPTANNHLFYFYGAERIFYGFSISQRYITRKISAEITALGQYFLFPQQPFYLLPAFLVAYQPTIMSCKKSHFIILQFYISGAKTMRQPTFTDLYYKTGDILGNNHLLPEKAYTVEIGTDWKVFKQGKENPIITFHLDIFHRWGIDLIDYIKEDESDKWLAVNHTSTQFTGLDSRIRFSPLSSQSFFSFLNYIQLQYSYLFSNKNSFDYQSRYVLDHLTHQFTVMVDNKIFNHFSLNTQFSYSKRKGNFLAVKDGKYYKNMPYPESFLLDIRLQYQLFSQYIFYIEATNILNQKYFDIGGLILPGIWMKGGFQFKLRS